MDGVAVDFLAKLGWEFEEAVLCGGRNGHLLKFCIEVKVILLHDVENVGDE